MQNSKLTSVKRHVHELEKGDGYRETSGKGLAILKYGSVKTSLPQRLVENPHDLPSELQEDKLQVVLIPDSGSSVGGHGKQKFLPRLVTEFIKEMILGQKVIIFETEESIGRRKEEVFVYIVKLLEYFWLDFQTPAEVIQGDSLEFEVVLKSSKTALNQFLALARLVVVGKDDELPNSRFSEDAQLIEQDDLSCSFFFEIPMRLLGSFQVRLSFSEFVRTDSAHETIITWQVDSAVIFVRARSTRPPYRKPPQAPPNFNVTPDLLIVSTKKLIEETKALTDRIVKEVEPKAATFERVILPIARDDNSFRVLSYIIQFFQEVSTDEHLRRSSRAAAKMIRDFGTDSFMREDVYKLIEAVSQKAEKLEPESERLLEVKRKCYVRNGLGLPIGPVRDRFKEIQKKLNHRVTDFEENLNEESGGLWFTREELEGMPNDLVEGLEKGTGDNKGKVKLSFKAPDLTPALKFALNGDVRKKMFIGNANKCNSNIPIFKEIITLRDEAARMLGYPDHASFQIGDRLAKTPNTVLSFLDDLRTNLIPEGIKEMKYLKDLKKEHLKSRGLETSYDGNYYLWDYNFYDSLMVKNEYFIDEQNVAEYFPLQPTLKGMLHIFEELFGLIFAEITSEDREKLSETNMSIGITWHEDVKLFSVWDDEREGGNFCGYLYLDLHPRTGKYAGGHTYPLQRGFLYPDGTRHYASTALICNFTRPTSTKPSLLRHSEIVTLFHELGHGIHDLVARTKYSSFHGTSVVWDFVEAPSQLLENWCWTSLQLKSLSNHYETGEKIPDNLIDKLIKARHVNSALHNLHQLHICIFDMAIYTPKSHEKAKSIEVSKLFNSLQQEILGYNIPELLGVPSSWSNGFATFKHLIKGYDAGYYSYFYSNIFAADMFYTFFDKDPMNAEEGRRYRHMVLEKGGSQDEMKTLEDYLGRKPSSEAFYRELGQK